MVFEGFDWDDGNREKCQKHGVSAGEIEALFSNSPSIQPDIRHSHLETRFLAVGNASGGRMIFLAFTLRGALIRPISARYMHAKEIKAYENATSSSQN